MAYEKNIEKKVAFGNNSLPAERIFLAKKFYYEKIYPDGNTPWASRPIDFVNENPLYGRVDLDKDFIYPRLKHVRPIKSGKTTSDDLRVFNFVALAFEDLRDYIQAQVHNGYIQEGDTIANCDPQKSFVDLESLQKQFKEIHWVQFSLIYLALTSEDDTLRSFPLKEQIDSCSQFIKYYKEFLKTGAPEFPITLSGLLNTVDTSPLITGLCIEIHDEGYDADSEKQKFISSPNFNFFKCAARRFGFMLDRNVPWRLVADITSHKMREYMRIAFEQPQIEEEQNKILQQRLNLLDTGMTPTTITVEDIVNFNLVNSLANWPPEKVLNFQKDTMKLMQGARKLVEERNSDNWEEVTLKGATDPSTHFVTNEETGEELLVPICEGTTCASRVMKLDFFFKEFYNKAHLEDAFILRQTMWQFWTSWSENHPYVKKVRTVGCVESGFKTKIVEEKEVQYIGWDTYLKEYSELFWLKFYFDTRSLENGIKWNSVEYKKKLRKINFLNKTFDFYRALDYISEATRNEMLEAQEIYVPLPESEEMVLDWV